jgi:hypothetical protein
VEDHISTRPTLVTLGHQRAIIVLIIIMVSEPVPLPLCSVLILIWILVFTSYEVLLEVRDWRTVPGLDLNRMLVLVLGRVEVVVRHRKGGLLNYFHVGLVVVVFENIAFMALNLDV